MASSLKLSDPDIRIQGARVHNLKNLHVTIKRNSLTVVTGVSGSGKSSLVFDTLFAEGQRRYVESLSAYARQFVGRLNKPDVDFIHGISPAIAIEQKVNTRNPRSTVATSTEIYEYLKLLFARTGRTYSPKSGQEVKRHTVHDVVDFITHFPEGQRLLLLVLLPVDKWERKPTQELDILIQKGFSRLYTGGEMVHIEDLVETLKKDTKRKLSDDTYLLVDRVVVDPGNEDAANRLADSVQTAFNEGHGELVVQDYDDPLNQWLFSTLFEADGLRFEEPGLHFFSFNNPVGACPRCEGFGSIIGIDERLVIPDASQSVYEGAIAPWRGEKMGEYLQRFLKIARKTDFPIHRSYSELNASERKYLWKGDADWYGLDGFFKELESQTYKIQYRVMLSRYRGRNTCPDCLGTRLRHDASYVRLPEQAVVSKPKFDPFKSLKSLQDVLLMTVDQAKDFFHILELAPHEAAIAPRILIEIKNRLSFLSDVGLGYLSLNRLSNTLSGGESQRINLATSLGSSLVGSLYILDEPSIGLHSRDTQRLIRVLKGLRDLGNTVVVVEHDEEVMEIADDLIDIGPEAGIGGGYLVFQGPLTELPKSKAGYTAGYLTGKERIPVPSSRRPWSDFIELSGAREHNLKNLNVKFPLHTLTVVTGVSGSGKTTLVRSVLYPALMQAIGAYVTEASKGYDRISGSIKRIKSVELVDQNPIGKSSRSNPVTYIKAYDAIRDLYASQSLAKQRGYKSTHFSFNVDGGRCETCAGEGETTIEMQFMADIRLQCEDCGGTRFKEEIREVVFHEKSISQVLELTVDEAVEFFKAEKSIITKLKPLQDVGLGYVTLGQSASTLSGGEAQRVKLASFLGKGSDKQEPIFFIFDEPTTGLHFHDIRKLLGAFDALIKQGHTILVIEHNMEVIKCADWIIDLGPDAGDKGGNLVFEGKPEDLVKCKESLTGKYLAPKLKVR